MSSNEDSCIRSRELLLLASRALSTVEHFCLGHHPFQKGSLEKSDELRLRSSFRAMLITTFSVEKQQDCVQLNSSSRKRYFSFFTQNWWTFNQASLKYPTVYGDRIAAVSYVPSHPRLLQCPVSMCPFLMGNFFKVKIPPTGSPRDDLEGLLSLTVSSPYPTTRYDWKRHFYHSNNEKRENPDFQ